MVRPPFWLPIPTFNFGGVYWTKFEYISEIMGMRPLDVCTNGNALLSNLPSVNCDASSAAWAAEALMSTGKYWCADSIGTSKQEDLAKGTATVCS